MGDILSEKTEFKDKKEVRQKQIKIQKEYVERKQDIRPKTEVKKRGRKSEKYIEAASKIQKFYRNEKERNEKERKKHLNPEKYGILNFHIH